MRRIRAVCAGTAIGLALVGCGGGTSTTGTPAEPTHAARVGEPALIAVPGYDYRDDPQFRARVQPYMSSMTGFKDLSAHGVTQNGDRIGTLVLLEATPAHDRAVELGTVDPMPPAGEGQMLQGTFRYSTVAGERVLQIDHAVGWLGRNTPTLWLWYLDGTLSQFSQSVGAAKWEAMDFVKAYLRETNDK